MPGLAEVLRTYGESFRGQYCLPLGGEKVWRAIVNCRTPALGGHIETCDHCGKTRHIYHSCRNRHCPQCQTRAKEAWIAARKREVLPVPYFHLVFTLPHSLNPMIASHPSVMYDNLFAAASATLNQFADDPKHLGGSLAFSLILHTWQQDLSRHVHVHALVAGGALSKSGEWLAAKKGFLFPVKMLSQVFRGKFIAGLKELKASEKLSADFTNDVSWRSLLRQLYVHNWVVYAKETLAGASQVIEYLGRYTHRVAISNERIRAIKNNQVCFKMRPAKGSKQARTMRLDGAEFIRRFFMHVLPAGFKRIRHYGLLAPQCKARLLAIARDALHAPQPDPVVIETVADFMRRTAKIEWECCSFCSKGQWRVTTVLMPLRPAYSHLPRAPP